MASNPPPPGAPADAHHGAEDDPHLPQIPRPYRPQVTTRARPWRPLPVMEHTVYPQGSLVLSRPAQAHEAEIEPDAHEAPSVARAEPSRSRLREILWIGLVVLALLAAVGAYLMVSQASLESPPPLPAEPAAATVR